MDYTNYPVERNLDGIFFRVERNGKDVSLCFTDLTASEQEDVLSNYDRDALLRMCKILAKTLRGIGDFLDIFGADD